MFPLSKLPWPDCTISFFPLLQLLSGKYRIGNWLDVAWPTLGPARVRRFGKCPCVGQQAERMMTPEERTFFNLIQKALSHEGQKYSAKLNTYIYHKKANIQWRASLFPLCFQQCFPSSFSFPFDPIFPSHYVWFSQKHLEWKWINLTVIIPPGFYGPTSRSRSTNVVDSWKPASSFFCSAPCP